MKIVLSPKEVNKIIVEHLLKTGELKNKETTVTWRCNRFNMSETKIEVTQDEE